MTAKLLTAVLVVAAFGCARSASTGAPPVAHAKTATTTTVAASKPREPRQVAKELKPDSALGVALHGPEKGYLEQVDNSGWSGRSPELTPDAVGGGPPAETSEPAKSKDLDTNTDEEQSEAK